MIDNDDLNLLMEHNENLAKTISSLNGKIDDITRLKIILIDKMQDEDLGKMSFENKLIKIRKGNEDFVDDYFRVEADIKKLENLKHQYEEAIRSLKKKLDVVRNST